MKKIFYICSMAIVLAVSSTILAEESFIPVDLGSIMVGVQEKRSIPVENSTDAEMSISKVRVSCDCIKILSYPRRLAAGEKGKVEIIVAPKRVGQYNYVIKLEKKGEKTPLMQYRLLLKALGQK